MPELRLLARAMALLVFLGSADCSRATPAHEAALPPGKPWASLTPEQDAGAIEAPKVELPSGPGFEQLSFAAAEGAIDNPERGFYSRINLLSDRQADYSSLTPLLHTYIRLDQYRATDLDDELLDAIDAGLERVRTSGRKVIVRFAYNFGPYPDCEPDASEAQILVHIEQLAAVLQRNADVIAWFEAGFIGCWGEWHASTHRLDASTEAKLRIVRELLERWPAVPVQIRYPNDLRLLKARLAAVPGADRLGFHNDCVFASEPDDWGTWGRGGGSVSGDKHFVQEVAASAPIGGETCNVSSRSTCKTALTELAAQGWTDLNGGFHAGVLQQFADEGCLGQIEEKLGYRFRLLRASVPTRLEMGQPLELGIELVNEGWAPLYRPRPLFVVLEAGGTQVVLDSQADPRELRPGQPAVLLFSLTLPASVGDGRYRLGIWLPDEAPRLRDDARYAVRLANSGLWDGSGVNWIASDVVIGTEPDQDDPSAQGGAGGAGLAAGAGAAADVSGGAR